MTTGDLPHCVLILTYWVPYQRRSQYMNVYSFFFENMNLWTYSFIIDYLSDTFHFEIRVIVINNVAENHVILLRRGG